MIENDLSQALNTPLRPEPRFDDDWDAFHRRARRTAVASKVAATSMVLIPLVALAGVVGALRQGPAWTRLGDASLLAGGTPLIDERNGYEVTQPEGWSARIRPDGRLLISPDGRAQVLITVETPRDFDDSVSLLDRPPTDRLEEARHATEINGRDAVSFASFWEGRPVAIRTLIDLGAGSVLSAWAGPFDESEVLPTPQGMAELFESNAPAAMAIVGSIKPFGLAATAPAGWFAATIELDPMARGLQRFLEARIDGEGAERFLDPEPRATYEHPERRPHLYVTTWLEPEGEPTVTSDGRTTTVTSGGMIGGENGTDGWRQMEARFYRYEVIERGDMERGRSMFTVRLFYRETPIGEDFTLEQIVMRPDGSSYRVAEVDERGGGSAGRPTD